MSEITYYRGDSYAKVFTVKDKATGDPIDLTGAVLTMTINTEKDPADTANQLFDLVGVIDDVPTTGKVSFTPSETDTNQTPGKYFYDIQLVDGSGAKRTIAKDKFIITQDITKS